MAVEVQETAQELYTFWQTVDVAPNGDVRDIRLLRLQNRSEVPFRVKASLGRGGSYQEWGEMVPAGQDVTVDVAARNGGVPLSVRGAEWGVVVEQA